MNFQSNNQDYIVVSDLLKEKESLRNIQIIASLNNKRVLKTSVYDIRTEFSLMQRLQSNYIGRVIEMHSNNSYSMDYYEKGDLYNRKRPLNETAVRNIFRQICECVNFIHIRGVVHLDLSLKNFLKIENALIKIIDFGHATDKDCEKIMIVKGSDHYNAPERYNPPYNGYQADIYSLGIILVHLLCGEFPFIGSNNSYTRYRLFRENPDRFWLRFESHFAKKYPDFKFSEEAISLIE